MKADCLDGAKLVMVLNTIIMEEPMIQVYILLIALVFKFMAKVNGIAKKHGESKRKRYVKFHVVVDGNSLQIVDFVATNSDIHDCEIFDQLN